MVCEINKYISYLLLFRARLYHGLFGAASVEDVNVFADVMNTGG